MERQHSTLELVKHDETARAPERDYDATAFELDHDALAPEVVPDTSPQVVYDSSFPEALGHTEDPPTERASSQSITKAALKWLLMTVTLIVAVSIAIGAGVGTWSHRRYSHKPSSAISPPSQTISPPAPHNHSFIPAAQHILNDTSLAALTLSNGDRQLFFQDITGLIRRAVRIASNSQWNTSRSLNFSTSPSGGLPVPKNNTPLTCTVSEDQYGANIVVYYVSENNYISSSVVEDGFLGGAASYRIQASGQNHSTAVGTRTLSITSVPGSTDTTLDTENQNLAILYYENPAGNVSALLQRLVWINSSKGGQEGSQAEYQWHDITSQSSKSLPSDFLNVNPKISHTLWEATELLGGHIRLSTPFTSMANFSGGDMGALFYAPDNGSIVSEGYSIGLQGPSNYSNMVPYSLIDINEEMKGPNQRYSPIQQSDLVAFDQLNMIWVNGTQLMTFGVAPQNTSFPFTRLASVNSADQSTSFLYHQINHTTLAEEQWDKSEQMWLPTQYITVSDS